LVIPIVFYVVVAAARLDLGALRNKGWLFDVGKSEAWYTFYSYYGTRPSLPPLPHPFTS
jgi:SulP family sulfate permease